MAELVVGDRTLALDEDGFLEDASLWDEEVAEKLAETEDVVLTDEHWEVINYLRGTTPSSAWPPWYARC